MPSLLPSYRSARLLGLAALALAVGAGVTTAQPAASGPWFTQEQADAGLRDFNTNCAACHGYSIFTRFLKYGTAEKFYIKIEGEMPKWMPGSLPEEVYINVLAYMLQQSGFQAGDVELTSERARLRQIVLAEP